MPSDLQVSNIKDLTGSNTGLSIASDGQVSITQNNPTLTLGTNATFPAGHVIQTQIYEETTNWTQLMSGSGTEDFTIVNSSGTNFSVSITPKVTGSKNLVTVSIGCIGGHNAGSSYSLGLTAYRDSSKVGVATGSNTPLVSARACRSGSMYYVHGCHFSFLDSTANTKDTQVVYTLKAVRHANSDYTMCFNRGETTGSTNYTAGQGTTASYYIAQEVAQ